MITKKTAAVILLMVFFLNANAQVNAGNDTTICQGNSLTLHAQSDSAGAVTQLNLPDDTYSQPVDIGFPFTFFGNTYTQCLLSTNAYIDFDLSGAGAYSQYPINNPIPSTSNPTNTIMGAWHDVDPSVPTYGIMSYAIMGTAPNRYFVFNFCNVPEFQCNSLLYTGQIILYEGTSIIETHITNKPICSTWNNGGAAIHGLQNAAGTVAFVVPGRNFPTIWTTTNDGYRFSPDASYTNYTITPITFAPVPMLGGIQWTNLAGTFLGNDQDLVVSPTVTSSYIASVDLCNGSTFLDTVTVFVAPGSATFAHANSTCAQSADGWAAFIPQDTSTWNYTWENSSGTIIGSGTISQTPDTLFNITAGQYTLTLLNLAGCTITNTFNIQANLVNSVVYAQDNSTCPQSPDGYAAFTPQDTSTWNYVWENSSGIVLDSGSVNQASDTLFNLISGQYTLTLTNSVGCVITNNFNIQADIFNAAVVYSQINSSCIQVADGAGIFTPQDTSTWSFVWFDSQNNILSTGSVNQTADTLLNLLSGQYTLVLSNSYGCTVSHNYTVNANPFTASFTVSPAPLCDEKPVNFSNTSVGTIDNYAWSFGDGNNASTASANHIYSPAGNYNVVLIISNNIGCLDTASTLISVLPNIIADFSFEPIEGCVGEFIEFSDKSNLFPIAWDWNFGDSHTDNTENAFHAFGADGQYTVSLTVTDSLCGTDTKTLPIIIHFVPDVFIGNDTSLCKYEQLYLDAGYPGTTYLWSTGETTQVITPPMADQNTYYSVIVNNFGCLGYDTLLAEINCDVIMPSAFSPNGDGFNDIFRPRGFRITNYTMTIFDRWGGVIFEINSPSINNGWDGKINGEDAEIGVYVYYMNATFINGEQESNSGNVTLLR